MSILADYRALEAAVDDARRAQAAAAIRIADAMAAGAEVEPLMLTIYRETTAAVDDARRSLDIAFPTTTA